MLLIHRLVRLCAVLLFGLMMVACAAPSRTMAFGSDADKLTATNDPVFLMTVTIKNLYRPGAQPKLDLVSFDRSTANEKIPLFGFVLDEKAKDESDSVEKGNHYLLRMRLAPGQYRLMSVSGRAGVFPIMGVVMAPLHLPLKAGEAGVFYLGHVDAILRERQGNEFKAGPTLPLIDQAVVGASGGTFDITISDQQAVDEPAFRARFPALAGVPIKKAILPAFDRSYAQQFWEKN
ncbi:MAG: hypothetical protein ACT6Q9_18870 [Polaromonas sp.]|uniref:hypothetical protein n=1 Tax=Polaromonas sp. TaxID=1869339 RepID=UPI0040369968